MSFRLLDAVTLLLSEQSCIVCGLKSLYGIFRICFILFKTVTRLSSFEQLECGAIRNVSLYAGIV